VDAVNRSELYPINVDKQPWKKMELRVRLGANTRRITKVCVRRARKASMTSRKKNSWIQNFSWFCYLNVGTHYFVFYVFQMSSRTKSL